MRHVAPIRAELGLRTIFNLLGPLSNPAGARRQLLGVYAARLVPLVARTLLELGAERALVVHGDGGLDEISPSGATVAAQVDRGELRALQIEPEQLGLPREPIEGLRGGDAAENARLVREVLEGRPGVRRTAVLLNAAGALWAAGVVDELREGARLAAEAIDSGAALARLTTFAALSQAQKQRAAGAP
jgi:anthranilate phosphoribosyltransferase